MRHRDRRLIQLVVILDLVEDRLLRSQQTQDLLSLGLSVHAVHQLILRLIRQKTEQWVRREEDLLAPVVVNYLDVPHSLFQDRHDCR